MKLVVAGGGSTYTPELMDGIARLGTGAEVSEIVLVDPDAARLEVVGSFCVRLLRRHDSKIRLRWTRYLEDAAEGAHALVLQLRVGGQATRHRDETWPLEFGCVGQETTGAGGFAKALRTVPVVLAVADQFRRLADPGAWIIDFTNPVGIVTRALLDAGHRVIGLCNVAIGNQRLFARLLGVEPERVALDHAGLNHLTWERAALVDGTDRLPQLLAGHESEIFEDDWRPPDGSGIPSSYLRYYWAHDAVVDRLRKAPQTRAEEVAAIERALLAMYADPALDTKPDLLGSRGGAFYSEAAVELLQALTCDDGSRLVVNVRNNGTMPFLPDEAVIEVPAVVGERGAAPLPLDPLAPLQRGLVAHVSCYEELAVEAAIRGGRDRVAAALLAHPLVGKLDLAARLTDRLIAENAGFLSWAR